MAAKKVEVMDDNKKKGDGCLKAAAWIGIILTLLAVAHGLFLFAEVFSGQSFPALTSPSGAAGYTVPSLLTAGMLALGLFLIRKFTRKTVFKPFHDHEALRKAKEAYRQKMENPLITDEDRVALQERFRKALALPSKEKGSELYRIFEIFLLWDGFAVMPQGFADEQSQFDLFIGDKQQAYTFIVTWDEAPVQAIEILPFYKHLRLNSGGIWVAMNGFTEEAKMRPPKNEVQRRLAKEDAPILLFDGVHIANVIDRVYSFADLLKHALQETADSDTLFCSYPVRQ